MDVQNQLELVGSAVGQQGGQVLAEAWHAALEDSVAAHFPGNALINCMCHNTSVSAGEPLVLSEGPWSSQRTIQSLDDEFQEESSSKL